MSQIRVLIVGPTPPPFGGMPRYVHDLLHGSLRRRLDLHHFDTSFSEKIRTYDVNRGHQRWLPGRHTGWKKYTYLFAEGPWGGLRLMVAAVKSYIRFVFRISRLEPDLVHVFTNMHWGYWRNSGYVLLARAGRTRVVFHPLGAIDQFYENSGALGRRAISTALNLAHLVLVQSPGLARVVAGMTRREVEGIFNGIDLKPFSGAHQTPRPSAKNLVTFLAVGDLGHNKGSYDILSAASRMNRSPARWVFVGRGSLEEMRRRADAAGIGSQVEFRGAVDEAEKINAYRQADVFLLPSYGEGQPLAILEAMAAGLPVISSTVGSIPEVIGPENGFLVRPGDIDALLAAMQTLMHDGALRARMGAVNAAAARERFGLERLHREIERTYEKVLAVSNHSYTEGS